jgi:hypothetical protein
MMQNKRVLCFVAVFFILALISAVYPAEDQLLGKSDSFGQPAVVIHPLSHVDLGLCLIRTSAPPDIFLSIPNNVASFAETRAPPA